MAHQYGLCVSEHALPQIQFYSNKHMPATYPVCISSNIMW